ncbi:MAG: four helix bundle protein, partial [candidate division WOR-3 bacterium]
MKSFEDLDVWEAAHELVLEIYRITKSFPEEERFRLIDQLCRSAASIPANIAEGTGKKTLNEYIQFLYNARGSFEETRYHLILARDLDYVDKTEFDTLTKQCNSIGKMLNGLIKSLKSSKRK